MTHLIVAKRVVSWFTARFHFRADGEKSDILIG